MGLGLLLWDFLGGQLRSRMEVQSTSRCHGHPCTSEVSACPTSGVCLEDIEPSPGLALQIYSACVLCPFFTIQFFKKVILQGPHKLSDELFFQRRSCLSEEQLARGYRLIQEGLAWVPGFLLFHLLQFGLHGLLSLARDGHRLCFPD